MSIKVTIHVKKKIKSMLNNLSLLTSYTDITKITSLQTYKHWNAKMGRKFTIINILTKLSATTIKEKYTTKK